MSALISYGFDGALQALLHDGTFVTVVTAWPDVTDKSVEANIGRIIGYLLWCTRQCQLVCSFVYSAQIIVNVAVMCVLMLQMVNSERTLASAFTIVLATVALLSSTGILMSNAGDITFEATLVPTAMYSSGWQNCRGERSRRVRKLMVIAMNEAQKPVIIRSFGIMEISYQSFVSMVKASYSAFSFLY
ncbi:jg26156 [Pararge aegeria aegeria]|uniref:Jg26156 protein n=1 Tax=Pararge aegeria aegeria TaxID=348720 RepID=A0A8S4RXP9_9NEOP|nr:jg26156 [Pararge aegeria aegeria]